MCTYSRVLFIPTSCDIDYMVDLGECYSNWKETAIEGQILQNLPTWDGSNSETHVSWDRTVVVRLWERGEMEHYQSRDQCFCSARWSSLES